MFNPNIIKTNYALAASQGDSRVAQRKYIIAHESGYEPDTKNPDMLLNEVQNMKNNFNGSTPYVTHFIGYMDSADEVQVYQIGEPSYVSWGALDANPYAPVQIEFARIYQNDKTKFSKAYRVYVEALRYYANLYGIPLKLDEPGNGIKSHLWVTNNFGGTHTDPYDYFERMGISKAQFKHDVENGFKSEPVKVKDTIVNVVQAATDKVEGYTTYKLDGTANETTNITPGSKWISNGIAVINGKAHFAIGGDIYLPQSSTTLRGKLIINYIDGYGVKSFNHAGTSIDKSNQKFKAGSEWQTMNDLVKIPSVGYCYKVATDEYVTAKYQQGSGFKG